MKTLRTYAKEHCIGYRAAWNRFNAGKIEGAVKNSLGHILVPDDTERDAYTVVYARVSSSENRGNLDSQADRLCAFSAARGWKVSEVVKECGSGLNDRRRKLGRVMSNPFVTRIVVEHRDRLTRFGFEYLKHWADLRGCELVVINETDGSRDDLMQDFVALVTSFAARLYGLRRSRRRTETIIEELSKADD